MFGSLTGEDGVQCVADRFADLVSPLCEPTHSMETSLYGSETMCHHLPEWMVSQLVDDGRTTDTGSSDDDDVAVAPSSSCTVSDGPDNYLGSGATTPAEAQPLVELDVKEGKRRGGELLAMLKEEPASLPTHQLGLSGVEDSTFCHWTCADADRSRATVARQHDSHNHGMSWMGGGYSGCTGIADTSLTLSEVYYEGPYVEEDAGEAMQAATNAAAIREAARRAFGAGVADITRCCSHDGNRGYTVQLRGGCASELRRDARVVLDAFARTLWPLLDREIVALEHYVDGVRVNGGGTGLSVPCWPMTTRLTMRELIDTGDACWDFSRRGICPRGARCRWKHVPMQTRATDIEVVW